MSLWRTESRRLFIGAGDWAAQTAALPAGARLDVTVADCWARYFMLAQPEDNATMRDGRLLLAARFETLYGDPADEWLLQADWRAGPMLACALPRALVQALGRGARIAPLLLRLWNAHCARLPREGAWCTQAGDTATLLYWQEGSIRMVRQQRGANAEALLALELARLDAPPPVARYWTGSPAPAGWMQMEPA